MLTTLAWIRALHFGACLLLTGTEIFDHLIASPVLRAAEPAANTRWSATTRRLTRWALLLALLSGASWFLFVAAEMNDLPLAQILNAPAISPVWNDTLFGTVCKWRLALWTAAAIIAALRMLRSYPPLVQNALAFLALLVTSALAVSLAWVGHGLIGPPWHRYADALHLLAAAVWPATLLPLALLLHALRTMTLPDLHAALWTLICRFSTLSIFAVLILAATGMANEICLLGSLSALLATPYGRLLLAKMCLFALIAAIGALNLLVLRPRLSVLSRKRSPAAAHSAHRLISLNVTLELLLACIVLIIVGILGRLPPPLG